MSLPYAPNCTNGQGVKHSATGYIISPTGRHIGAMCLSCAEEVIDEYKDKLGQVWTFEPQEWQPVPVDEEVTGRGLHQLRELGTIQGESIQPYIDPKDLQLARICSYDNVNLPENTLPSEIDCPFCEALPGDIHARTCHNGERWKQAKEIRDSAARLGKLGGKAKTEKKAKAAKENGKRGGRPQSSQLEMEDI